MTDQGPTMEELLICPDWEQRRQDIDCVQMQCTGCTTYVAMSRSNAPIVAERNITVVCHLCAALLRAASEILGEPMIELGVMRGGKLPPGGEA